MGSRKYSKSSNRSRGVTFEKHNKLPSQFLFYDHVTNVLALIMKDKAERNRELAIKKTLQLLQLS